MEQNDEQRLVSRRDFLAGLRKWSAAAIGVAVGGSVFLRSENAAAWVNRRGSWINGPGAGGWVNRNTTWANRAVGGGSAWVNRRGW